MPQGLQVFVGERDVADRPQIGARRPLEHVHRGRQDDGTGKDQQHPDRDRAQP